MLEMMAPSRQSKDRRSRRVQTDIYRHVRPSNVIPSLGFTKVWAIRQSWEVSTDDWLCEEDVWRKRTDILDGSWRSFTSSVSLNRILNEQVESSHRPDNRYAARGPVWSIPQYGPTTKLNPAHIPTFCCCHRMCLGIRTNISDGSVYARTKARLVRTFSTTQVPMLDSTPQPI